MKTREVEERERGKSAAREKRERERYDERMGEERQKEKPRLKFAVFSLQNKTSSDSKVLHCEKKKTAEKRARD